MLLDPPTFVVQRRINHPLSATQRGIADRSLLAPTCEVELDGAGFMYLAEPLRPVAPFSSRQPTPTWCATALLLTPRKRSVAAVEIEVSMWSQDATSITVRPDTRHPERWSGRRVRRYFAAAHGAADEVARLLGGRARSAFAAENEGPIALGDHGAVPVGTRS